MDKYDIKEKLEELKSKKFNLVANEGDVNEIKNIESQITSLEESLREINDQENSRRKEKEGEKEYEEKKYLKEVTKEINTIDPHVFEKSFPDVYKKFYRLLWKEFDLKFGNNSGAGEITIKKMSNSNFTLKYDFFCYDERASEIEFTLFEKLEDFLKSVKVRSASAANYKSNFGHGSTYPTEYSGKTIISDIFQSFQKTILNSKS